MRNGKGAAAATPKHQTTNKARTKVQQFPDTTKLNATKSVGQIIRENNLHPQRRKEGSK